MATIRAIPHTDLLKLIALRDKGMLTAADDGLYLSRDAAGAWIACDNSTSECWVEDFATARAACRWLLRKETQNARPE